jgi:predicted nucleic acid-binding protein
MAAAPVVVIADTTVLSNFAAAGCLSLLHELLGEVYISTEVYAEVQDGLANGYLFYAGIDAHVHPLAADGWLRLTSLEGDAERRLFGNLPRSLHPGEASCLAVAALRGWALLSDDERARKAAGTLGVLVSGTLGVLVMAVRGGLLTLSEANALLGRMIRAGFRAPVSDLVDLVERPAALE